MIYLRRATLADIDLLYEWANDSVTRVNSFNTSFIPYEDHKKWFLTLMQSTSSHQFILMNGESPIGQVRLDVKDHEAEIGYSIAKEYRGQGFGHKILKLLSEKVQEQFPEIQHLIAKVKPSNIASKKLFESEGYEMKYSCYSLNIVKSTVGGGYWFNLANLASPLDASSRRVMAA